MDHLCDEVSQLRVAEGQPSAGGHSIGLVLELLWVEVVEVLQGAANALSSGRSLGLKGKAEMFWGDDTFVPP